jgi:hypothetical protein
MSKGINKKNEEKLKIYLAKNGINIKPSDKKSGNVSVKPQNDKPLLYRGH